MRKWLKNRREEKNLSQDAIAKKLRISQQYYSMIENGERQNDMPISMVEKISTVLDIPITNVLEYERNREINKL